MFFVLHNPGVVGCEKTRDKYREVWKRDILVHKGLEVCPLESTRVIIMVKQDHGETRSR